MQNVFSKNLATNSNPPDTNEYVLKIRVPIQHAMLSW